MIARVSTLMIAIPTYFLISKIIWSWNNACGRKILRSPNDQTGREDVIKTRPNDQTGREDVIKTRKLRNM